MTVHDLAFGDLFQFRTQREPAIYQALDGGRYRAVGEYVLGEPRICRELDGVQVCEPPVINRTVDKQRVRIVTAGDEI